MEWHGECGRVIHLLPIWPGSIVIMPQRVRPKLNFVKSDCRRCHVYYWIFCHNSIVGLGLVWCNVTERVSRQRTCLTTYVNTQDKVYRRQRINIFWHFALLLILNILCDISDDVFNEHSYIWWQSFDFCTENSKDMVHQNDNFVKISKSMIEQN